MNAHELTQQERRLERTSDQIAAALDEENDPERREILLSQLDDVDAQLMKIAEEREKIDAQQTTAGAHGMNWLRTNDANGPGEIADCLDNKGRTIRAGYYTNADGRICTWIEREEHRCQSYAHQTPPAARDRRAVRSSRTRRIHPRPTPHPHPGTHTMIKITARIEYSAQFPAVPYLCWLTAHTHPDIPNRKKFAGCHRTRLEAETEAQRHRYTYENGWERLPQ